MADATAACAGRPKTAAAKKHPTTLGATSLAKVSIVWMRHKLVELVQGIRRSIEDDGGQDTWWPWTWHLQ